ncbi:MAG: hypothetical protein HY870_11340 [Chloroflexi bacterium]|nr:hypothetical protein [Chloroflexota bacterium]
MFKRFTLLALVALIALSACSSTPAAPAPSATTNQDTYVSANFDTSYEGALSARNQLALGALQLDGTANAITADQARTLLTLWQALRGTTQSGASAQAEVSALLSQIEGALTADQLAAIKALKLTQTSFQQWAAANGLTVATGSGQPGGGQGLSPEARATRQASEGRTGQSGSGTSTAVISAVIAYLETLVQ